MRTVMMSLCCLFMFAFVVHEADAQSITVHAGKPVVVQSTKPDKTPGEIIVKKPVKPVRYREIVVIRYEYACDCCCCCRKPVNVVREIVRVPIKVTGNVIKETGELLDKTGQKIKNLANPCKDGKCLN